MVNIVQNQEQKQSKDQSQVIAQAEKQDAEKTIDSGLFLSKSGNHYHLVRWTRSREVVGYLLTILAVVAVAILVLFILLNPGIGVYASFVVICIALFAFITMFYSYAFNNVDLKRRSILIVPTDQDMIELPYHDEKLAIDQVTHLSEPRIQKPNGQKHVQLVLHAKNEQADHKQYILAEVKDRPARKNRLHQMATRLSELLNCRLATA